tara:strand:- start:2266 stop:2793 length:528 start_codon:yes stop_codon:yes gene_type:complete
MATLSVDDFKAKLIGGGARPNLFQATLNFPGYAAGNVELAAFMCKGAQLPGSTISPIPVPFRGRQLQLAGDRTFEPWTVTIVNDTGMEIRNAMERWMNGINSHTENTGLSNPIDYIADMVVEQYDKAGNVTKRYDMRGVWPSMISSIELSYESNDQIEEFTVEFQIAYWESNTTS